MIRAVFFDVGGVLASGNFESERASKAFHVNNRKLGIIISKFGGPCEEAKISDNEFLLKVSEGFSLDFSYVRKIWLKTYEENLKINKDVYRIVFAMKKRLYKIGIISNVKRMYTAINNKKKIYFGFWPVVLSYKVGIIKPNKRIYALACRRAKVKPNEAVLIDDRILNIKGARAFGMKAILYKNPEQLKRELKKLRLKF